MKESKRKILEKDKEIADFIKMIHKKLFKDVYDSLKMCCKEGFRECNALKFRWELERLKRKYLGIKEKIKVN